MGHLYPHKRLSLCVRHNFGNLLSIVTQLTSISLPNLPLAAFPQPPFSEASIGIMDDLASAIGNLAMGPPVLCQQAIQDSCLDSKQKEACLTYVNHLCFVITSSPRESQRYKTAIETRERLTMEFWEQMRLRAAAS